MLKVLFLVYVFEIFSFRYRSLLNSFSFLLGKKVFYTFFEVQKYSIKAFTSVFGTLETFLFQVRSTFCREVYFNSVFTFFQTKFFQVQKSFQILCCFSLRHRSVVSLLGTEVICSNFSFCFLSGMEILFILVLILKSSFKICLLFF